MTKCKRGEQSCFLLISLKRFMCMHCSSALLESSLPQSPLCNRGGSREVSVGELFWPTTLSTRYIYLSYTIALLPFLLCAVHTLRHFSLLHTDEVQVGRRLSAPLWILLEYILVVCRLVVVVMLKIQVLRICMKKRIDWQGAE